MLSILKIEEKRIERENNMILGHERQIKYLEQVLKSGRFAHAYLFYGPEGIGKFTIAKAAAKFFNCQNHPSFRETDECGQCKLIEKNLHPQVIILDPENTLVSKKETRKEIPIGDIRELKRKLIFAPAPNEWRVVIINQADKMSREAQDAFLKLLEEPGPQTLIMLVTAAQELLAPTIISRTQPIHFSLVPEKLLAELLKSRKADSAEEILFFPRGRPGVMIKMLGDQEYLEQEKKIFKQVSSLLERREVGEAFLLADKVSWSEELRTKVVSVTMELLRIKLKKNIGGGDLVKRVNTFKKLNSIATLMETTNVNPRLAMDVFFLEALEN